MIPLQSCILGALLLLLGALPSGFYAGHHWATTSAEAARAKAADAHIKQMNAELKRSDALAARLVTAEGRIVIKTVEVIKHVPNVTTGRLCLGADAVRLLQPTAQAAQHSPPGEPAGESPAVAPASDRDVAYWAAEANRQYETAAARLNALIEWHQTDDPK